MAERQRSRFGTHEQIAPKSSARERAFGSMVSASVLATLGTLVFAWALRTPDYPWLFAVGAVPWLVGIILFARALGSYLKQ